MVQLSSWENLCILGNFAFICCLGLLNFYKNFSVQKKNIIFETVWIQIRPNILFGLIWVKLLNCGVLIIKSGQVRFSLNGLIDAS